MRQSIESRETKHERILNAVRKRIESGQYRLGERIPTDTQLVREFGVSRPTVAKALEELGRSGLLRRESGRGTFVGASNSVEAKRFGLLVPGIADTEIFEPICASMGSCAGKLGHSLSWGAGAGANSRNRTQHILDLCNHFVTNDCSGIFFAPLELVADHEAINARVTRLCGEAGIPVVLLDRDYVAYPERSRLDLVGIDNRRVGYQVTHHLIERACRRIAFVTRPGSAATSDQRISGYVDALSHTPNGYDTDLVLRAHPGDHDSIAPFMASRQPTGVVCANDFIACELIQTFERIGIQVPRDVMVAGIDDVRLAKSLRVPLTTMRQPCHAMGNAAIRTMLERIESPDTPAREVLLDCELVERASTRPAA